MKCVIIFIMARSEMFYKNNTHTHKKCPKCGERKERSLFHKDSTRKDGINAYCKECKIAKKS
jgi:predicted RNA-binding Zn-ribbon protein involved in translation (DUF1610 family)